MNFQRYSFGAQTRRSIYDYCLHNEHVCCNLYLVRALQCCLRRDISNNRVHMYTRNFLLKFFLCHITSCQ